MFANGLAVLNNERFLEKSACTLQRTTHNRSRIAHRVSDNRSVQLAGDTRSCTEAAA